MRFDELNWFDVENYLEKDDRLVLVLGACEQHGYLSLLTDILIPMALADSLSQKSGVLIAPPLNFGVSPYFTSFPGTLSLRATTLLDVVEDLVRSIYKQGFRRLLWINGHGGNDGARSRLYELLPQLPGLQIRWYSWWLSHSVVQVAEKHQLKPAHANWLEAFPFTRVAELPEGEKTPPHVNCLLGPDDTRRLCGDGSFGGPYQVEQSIMDEIFDVALTDVLQMIKFD